MLKGFGGILDNIKSLFSKDRWEKLDVEEIKTEKARLEIHEEKTLEMFKKVAGEREELFNQGFEASPERRKILAQKIVALDNRLKNLEKELMFVGKQIQLLDNIIILKEIEKATETPLMKKLLEKYGPAEVEKALERVDLTVRILEGRIEDMEAVLGAEGEREPEPVSKLMEAWEKKDESLLKEAEKSLEVKVRPHEEKEAQGRTSQGKEIEQILKAWEQKE